MCMQDYRLRRRWGPGQNAKARDTIPGHTGGHIQPSKPLQVWTVRPGGQHLMLAVWEKFDSTDRPNESSRSQKKSENKPLNH